MLRAADLAMYRAKRSGQHIHIHDPGHATIDVRTIIDQDRITIIDRERAATAVWRRSWMRKGARPAALTAGAQ